MTPLIATIHRESPLYYSSIRMMMRGGGVGEEH
jgi:hypothetical protein